MKVPSAMQMSEFDSSKEEPVENKQTPFQVSWLPLFIVNCSQFVGLCYLSATCLPLYLSDTVSSQGSGAIQTIKQYNYLHDFRDKLSAHLSTRDSVSRSVSRERTISIYCT
uniref:protein-tyrosine-phosphatase n=1 Tax=Vombatus ursinus TaxID=29139 RepID=A0A4X2KHY9_VOMUR